MADGSLIFNTKIDPGGFIRDSKNLSSKLIDIKNKVHDTEAPIRELTRELEKMANTPIRSDAAKNLEREISKAQQKLNALDEQLSNIKGAKIESLQSSGFTGNVEKAADIGLQSDTHYQKLSQSAEEYESKLRALRAELERVKAAESNMTGADTAEYKEKQAKLESLNGKLEVYKAKLNETEQAERASSSQTQSTSANASRYRGTINAAAAATKNFGSKIASVTKKLGAMVKTGVSKFFRGLTSGLKNATNHTGMLNKMTNIITRSFKRVFVTGLVLKNLRSILSGVKDGFGDIAKINPEVNESLSDLSSSFGYFKNSISAAFIPAIQAATPYLVQFMNVISGVTDKITQLASLITGKNTYAKAIKQQKDYAASLDSSSDSLKKNTKAVDENQRGLANFDELNVLQDNSGSGEDGAASDAAAFVNAEATADGIFDQIKEAIKSHNYEEIGAILGDKINDLLSKFNWSKIKAKAKNWGAGIAGLFNGVLRNTDWKQVGLTAAEGFNSVIAFMLGFSYTFDWKAFGKALKDSLVSFFKNLDHQSLIEAFDSLINGIVDAGLELVGDPDDWEQWGTDLENNIEQAIEGINWENVKQLFWNLLRGVFSFGSGFFGSLFDDLDKQLNGKDFKGIGKTLAKNLNSIDWEKTVGKESTIGKGISVISKAVMAGLDTVIGFLEEPGTADSISEGITTLLDNVPWAELLIKGLTALFDAVAWITTTATELVTEFGNGLDEGFGDLENNPELMEALKSMGRAFMNCLISVLESGLQTALVAIPYIIVGALKLILMGMVSIASAMSEKIWGEAAANKVMNDAYNLLYVEWKMPEAPEIHLPRLATGTVVPAHFGEYLAVLGDNKREPEVVSPLSTMKQALAEVLAEKGGSLKDIHLTLNLDGRTVFDRMVSINGEYVKSHGYSAFAKG